MLQRIHQKSRIITLICYSIYALSPIYAVLPPSNNVNRQAGPSQHHVKLGILWLNIVVDSLVDDDRTVSNARGDTFFQASQNDQDEDIVLIKKKRAVKRRFDLTQPILAQSSSAIMQIEPDVPAAHAYEIPRDQIHRCPNGYSLLSTGLSPPSFIS